MGSGAEKEAVLGTTQVHTVAGMVCSVAVPGADPGFWDGVFLTVPRNLNLTTPI